METPVALCQCVARVVFRSPENWKDGHGCADHRWWIDITCFASQRGVHSPGGLCEACIGSQSRHHHLRRSTYPKLAQLWGLCVIVTSKNQLIVDCGVSYSHLQSSFSSFSSPTSGLARSVLFNRSDSRSDHNHVTTIFGGQHILSLPDFGDCVLPSLQRIN